MNIANLLKYCPKGTKLYSTAFGEVELIDTSSLANTILVQNNHDTPFTFYSDGSYILDGECILFPSKDQRDWKELKIGDIMMEKNSKYRPFKDIEECLNEMQKHQPFGWIKNCGVWYNIVSTDVASVNIINTRGAIAALDFRHLLANYHFVDGTLFGIKIGEG